MDKCGNCLKPAAQLFETGKEGVYHCFKCQPLVPEVTIGDATETEPEPEPQSSTTEEESHDTSYYCSVCNKSFQKNMQLQNHMRNHRAERRFVCTYCNKAFSQSNNLRAHLRIHTNERPYKCSDCGKAFTQVTNLNNHVRLHTGERPFACPEPGCDKAYAQVTNLNQHRKRHMSGRPVDSSYDCTVCGERFTQRNHMYSHRRAAHSAGRTRGSGAAFACGVCPARLPSERLLHLHLANDHPSALKHDDDDDENSGGEYACVFPSCGARVSSPRAHTEHLLRAHQLRVLAAARTPPRRGRPPKVLKDPLEIPETPVYDEVKIIKEEPQYVPKLKVQSLFQ
ncbi:uncharacterized protein [Epargyreus clarus]|uniref:uncharacterized protein n=1 Tax=Epargyreus clarus TaxID=520877 RepID=UPI003C2CAC20